MEDIGFGVVLEVAEIPPVGGKALWGEGISGTHILEQTQYRLPLPQLHTHFQLPHHELLGHMVPPGLSEDGSMT